MGRSRRIEESRTGNYENELSTALGFGYRRKHQYNQAEIVSAATQPIYEAFQ